MTIDYLTIFVVNDKPGQTRCKAEEFQRLLVKI